MGTNAILCPAREPYTARRRGKSPNTDRYGRGWVPGSRRAVCPSGSATVSPTSPVPWRRENRSRAWRPTARTRVQRPRSTSWAGVPAAAAWRTYPASSATRGSRAGGWSGVGWCGIMGRASWPGGHGAAIPHVARREAHLSPPRMPQTSTARRVPREGPPAPPLFFVTPPLLPPREEGQPPRGLLRVGARLLTPRGPSPAPPLQVGRVPLQLLTVLGV